MRRLCTVYMLYLIRNRVYKKTNDVRDVNERMNEFIMIELRPELTNAFEETETVLVLTESCSFAVMN